MNKEIKLPTVQEYFKELQLKEHDGYSWLENVSKEKWPEDFKDSTLYEPFLDPEDDQDYINQLQTDI